MTETADILLLDDGELDGLAAQLERLEIAFTRLRGGEVGATVAPPRLLLVTTPRRAPAVCGAAPDDAPPGRPMRVIHADEDSPSMRRMLRERGFDLLVREPTAPAVWRLLVHRALYQGRERRRDERVAVGSEVGVATREACLAATLVDISNRGCRLAWDAQPGLDPAVGLCAALEEEARVRIELSGEATGEAPLALPGRVIRVQEVGSGATAAVLFGDGLDDPMRRRLARLLNVWTRPGAFAEASGPALPACESPVLPGLTLDDETDPAIRVGLAVSVHIAERERRRHVRAPFGHPVPATDAQQQSPSGSRVLLGRDLSAGGMRVEPLDGLTVGDRFVLSIWGPGRPDPHRIDAEVVRDDGEDGLGLAFRGVAPETARELEKIVACLPDVEPLQSGEAGVLGSVIGEIAPPFVTLGPALEPAPEPGDDEGG